MGTTHDGRNDNRTWKQRVRDSGADHSMRFDKGLNPKGRLKIAGVAVGTVAALVVLVGPVRAIVSDVLGGAGVVTPTRAELFDDSTGAYMDFAASMAIDGDEATGVGFDWPAGSASREACGSDPVAESVLLTVEEMETVSAIEVVVGLGASDEADLYLRPSVLEVWINGACVPLSAADHGGNQRLNIDEPSLLGSSPITKVGVGVVAVAESPNRRYPLAVIGEVKIVP